jgi:hypothetical protein
MIELLAGKTDTTFADNGVRQHLMLASLPLGFTSVNRLPGNFSQRDVCTLVCPAQRSGLVVKIFMLTAGPWQACGAMHFGTQVDAALSSAAVPRPLGSSLMPLR